MGAFISAAFAVIAVSVSAVFLGYLVGHVAIRSVTRPLVAELSGSSETQPTPGNDAGKEVPSARLAGGQAGGGTVEKAPRPLPAASPAPAPMAAAPSSGAASAGLWRVRAGAYATREEAEAALRGLQVYEPQAFVVVRDGVYRLQVGAFTERARAEALVTELARQGVAAEVVAP